MPVYSNQATLFSNYLHDSEKQIIHNLKALKDMAKTKLGTFHN